jgi:hypothetical protein
VRRGRAAQRAGPRGGARSGGGGQLIGVG